MGLYWGGLSGLVSLITLATVKHDWLGGGFAVSAIFGFIFGFMLGVAQGLPVVPFFVLTTVDTGVYIRVTRKKLFPCLYRCKHWATLHQREEIIVLFVDEDFKMISLLKGMPPVDAMPNAAAKLASII
jgi:hypothetical protein